MESEQFMSEKTTGEICYGAYAGDDTAPMWEILDEHQRHRWERAAKAAIGDYARILADVTEQRDQLRDQLAAVVNPTAEDYDNAAEILRLRDLVTEMCAYWERFSTREDDEHIAEWRQRAGIEGA